MEKPRNPLSRWLPGLSRIAVRGRAGPARRDAPMRCRRRTQRAPTQTWLALVPSHPTRISSPSGKMPTQTSRPPRFRFCFALRGVYCTPRFMRRAECTESADARSMRVGFCRNIRSRDRVRNGPEESWPLMQKPAVNPIALQRGEGEALWFFGALAIVKASSETTVGRVTVIEHIAPQCSAGASIRWRPWEMREISFRFWWATLYA